MILLNDFSLVFFNLDGIIIIHVLFTEIFANIWVLNAVFHETSAILWHYPASNYMFKVNSRNTRKRCEIYSNLTIKTPERCHWRRSGVIINFGQVNIGWVALVNDPSYFQVLPQLSHSLKHIKIQHFWTRFQLRLEWCPQIVLLALPFTLLVW